MKILAVADVHGKSEKLHLIKSQIQQHQPEYLIIAGDIINYFGANHFFNELSKLPIPILAVRGNSDLKSVERVMSRYDRITDLHLNEVQIASTPIIGVSGTVLLPFHSKVRLFEAKILAQLETKLTPKSILVVHPPPKGTVDKVGGKFHAGSKKLAELVEAKQPRLVICGHIHEDSRITTLGKTRVVNCSIGRNGKGALIEIGNSNEIEVQCL